MNRFAGLHPMEQSYQEWSLVDAYLRARDLVAVHKDNLALATWRSLEARVAELEKENAELKRREAERPDDTKGDAFSRDRN